MRGKILLPISLAVILLFALFYFLFLADKKDIPITIIQVINRTTFTAGSGFFIDKQYILTNAHMVKKNLINSLGQMEIYDGVDSHEATVVGFDSDSDIALLRPQNWCNVKIHEPCSVTVDNRNYGDEVITHGSRDGLLGYFGLLYFNFKTFKGNIVAIENQFGAQVIVHNSGIVHGYSGTPLLNRDDCYMGINYAISPADLVTSYAISTSDIKRVVPELKVRGHIKSSFLGLILKEDNGKIFVVGTLQHGPTVLLSKYKIPVIDVSGNNNPENNKPENVRYHLTHINGVEIGSTYQVWNLVRSLESGASIEIVVKDISGKSHKEKITPVDKFYYTSRYLFMDLVYNNRFYPDTLIV